MAIAAASVFEVRTGGSDNNGGGFVTGASGTDRTLQDTAHATLTVLSVVNATTTIITVSLTDYTVTANDVGNLLQVTGGTATAGFYQITAVNTGLNLWTLDRAVGTAGQTVVGAMGGALASPGKAAKAMTVTGNRTWVKAGTYTMTTSTAGAAGPLAFVNSVNVSMEGYSSTRGDRAGRPLISAGAVTTITMADDGNSSQQFLIHLEFDGNNGSGVSGIAWADNSNVVFDCKVSNCSAASQSGFSNGSGTGGNTYKCVAVNCTTGFSSCNVHRSTATGCGTGFGGDWRTIRDCCAYDNTGDGFAAGGAGDGAVINCTAYSNGGDGFDMAARAKVLINCVSTDNGGYGYNGSNFALETCAAYNNSSGRAPTSNVIYDIRPVTLTADPFAAAPTDFRPNNTAGGGALLRGAALRYFADQRDIGAFQHEHDG